MLPYLIGTMIELPRACLLADEIAEYADFFSFGTNDLTQTTYGFSRDDAGRFLPDYVRRDLLSSDPFAVLDQKGVGALIRMGVEKGRRVKTKLKIGICGEHGGEPSAVEFCHREGFDYVSCSPFYAFLVATQCIEAGADFDFDGLVTECASLDALRQRFGRLDRRGRRAASANILNRSDQEKGGDPIYGEALANTWSWLKQLADLGDEPDTVDMGIDALEPHLPRDPELVTSLRPPHQDTGVVLPAYFDLWAQTRPRPYVDPDVPTYLHGIGEGERVADVQVVWRDDLPQNAAATEAQAIATDRLETVPPGTLEALSLPPWTVRSWLANQAAPELADVEGQTAPEPAAPGTLRPFYVRKRDGAKQRSSRQRTKRTTTWFRSDDPDDLRPGTTVVVPASYGGIAASNTFDPLAAERVSDLGDAVQLLQRGRPMMRLTPQVTPSLFERDGESWMPSSSSEEDDPVELVRAALERLVEPDALPQHDWWRRALIDAVGRALHSGRERIVATTDGGWLVTAPRLTPAALRKLTAQHLGSHAQLEQDQATEATTEGTVDSGSLTGTPVPLHDHLVGVADWAEHFGKGCGLSEPLVAALKWAGRIHDVGKADARFQLMLHSGDPVRAAQAADAGELLAKSGLTWFDRAAMRLAAQRARYPRGQRHELVSLDMMERSEPLRARVEGDGAEWDLVLHLVASHHGWCRPFAPVADIDEHDDQDVALVVDGLELHGRTLHRRERLDSGVSRRFHELNRGYGWHELAYLEAILRLADMRRSEHEQLQGNS